MYALGLLRFDFEGFERGFDGLREDGKRGSGCRIDSGVVSEGK